MITSKSAIVDRLSELADPTRGRILCALEDQELSVAELQSVLQLPQSTVSRHLKILSRGGWVAARPDGAAHRYRLERDSGQEGFKVWHVIRPEIASSDEARLDTERLSQVLAARRQRSRAFFTTEAARWDSLRAELFGNRYELRALLGLLEPDWAVADLGCGTGELALALAPFVKRVIAVDESESMLEAAERRLAELPNVECRHGELELLPISEAELDAAFLVLVLPYVPDPGRVLAEAARALQPGGRLLILDMRVHERPEYEQSMGHLWRGFSEERIRQWLTAAGLIPGSWVPLPASPADRSSGLFVAGARKPR